MIRSLSVRLSQTLNSLRSSSLPKRGTLDVPRSRALICAAAWALVAGAGGFGCSSEESSAVSGGGAGVPATAGAAGQNTSGAAGTGGGSTGTGGSSGGSVSGAPAGGGNAGSSGSDAAGGTSFAGGGGLGGAGAAGTAGVAGLSGGGTAAGGSAGGGGSSGSGGSGGSGSGGTAPGSGVPKLVSTIDLKGASGCPGLRFGDLNGDGQLEIIIAQPTDQTTLDAYTPQFAVCVTAYDLKGNQLWQHGKPGPTHVASSDVPIQVYDMDGDGKAEVFVNMNNTEMSVLDGATGNVTRTITLPARGSNDSIAIANLRGKPWPQDLIVKTRYSQFWAITGIADGATPAGTVLWTLRKGPDRDFSDRSTGHFPLVYDWNADGKDEVMGGYDFIDSAGKILWTTSILGLHADAIGAADLDANPQNGYEIVIGGDVAAAFDWKTGRNLWKDNHTVEVQQLAVGDYRKDLPGLEVAMLDRIGPRNDTGVDANLLIDQHDTLLWKEKRAAGTGWLTVTENLTNWDGKGTDVILSYRRGNGGVFLYDGDGKTVATFPYPGKSAQTFAAHANLCGDGKEEVVVYDDTTLWIYANDGCDLNAPPAVAGLPQRYRLYNWSIYTGWINPDPSFYTPGTKR